MEEPYSRSSIVRFVNFSNPDKVITNVQNTDVDIADFDPENETASYWIPETDL